MSTHEQSLRFEMRRSGPTWWLLYAIVLLLLAVVWLVEVLVDGETLRTILELVTVVAGFALIGAWRWRNRIALELEKGRRPR